ncbi:LicD family protein [Kordiimonas sp.]|uniref:LicD family protein n=1 Tax=Kordiimonas sp. TaxID=1970157 RepID=UPI003A8E996E
MNKPGKHYSDTLQHTREVCTHFAMRRERPKLKEVFPGEIVSLGSALTPISMPVDGEYRAFTFQLCRENPEILNFAAARFIGRVEGEPKLQDVSEHAVCTQSTCHEKRNDPYAAVTGGVFGPNIHSKREPQPWWRAEFPSTVKVNHVYFYHRMDRNITRTNSLRIFAEDANGVQHDLYHPHSHLRSFIDGRLQRAIDDIDALRDHCDEARQAEYEGLVSAAFGQLSCLLKDVGAVKHFRRANPPKGKWRAFKWKLAKRFMPGRDKRLIERVKGERTEIARKLLDALDIAISNVHDFGGTPETSKDVRITPTTARHIRVRTVALGCKGLGGLRVYTGDDAEVLAQAFDGKTMKFHHDRAAFVDAEAFGLNLQGPVSTKIVDLEQETSVARLQFWNRSQLLGGGTMFLQIALSNDKQNWTTVYDHGATFRHVMGARQLVDMLIGNQLSKGYGRLIGKLYTLYRCKFSARPTAKMVGKYSRPALSALLKGSEDVAGQINHSRRMLFTKHGMNIPLRERNEAKIMKHLVEFRDSMEKVGFEPFLLYGTLLGAIREKDFIPHDDDLDTAIILECDDPETLVDERDRIVAFLNENGVPCSAPTRRSPLIHCKRGDLTIDIFVLGLKDDTIYWPHTRLVVVPERADIFLPLGEIEFKGERFKAPFDPEAVSEARYGAGWRTPEPSFEI